ncbi:transglutaminase family protein [Hoeflea sp. TYP-13]|uniref:transglutaminase family protein n=1 Tax=Hoeflea sp. TYP-13 TaxID=3230023 RepID=UPI0034C64FA4
MFSTPDGFDYAQAKLSVDKLIDPDLDRPMIERELDAMESTVRKMLSTIPETEAQKSIEKLRALKAFLYKEGHWNNSAPFKYDFDDPFGRDIRNKLLATYLETRKGNCVSMPVLFLAIGERLGLDLTLSVAPLHVLVKYTDDQTAKTYNLEATSGAGFTRDQWYRKKTPMSDAALENGVYLKPLSRQETLAVIATTVLEFLIEQRRYQEAIAVSDVLIEAYPDYVYAMVKKGTAYFHLLKDVQSQQTAKAVMRRSEASAKANYYFLENQRAFAAAEDLGWIPPQN